MSLDIGSLERRVGLVHSLLTLAGPNVSAGEVRSVVLLLKEVVADIERWGEGPTAVEAPKDAKGDYLPVTGVNKCANCGKPITAEHHSYFDTLGRHMHSDCERPYRITMMR